MLFTLAAIVHAGGALFLAYLAAGYEMAAIAAWLWDRLKIWDRLKKSLAPKPAATASP
jgi:hypothetical protein